MSRKPPKIASTWRQTIALYWEQIRKNRTSFFVALVATPLSALSIDTFLPYFLSMAIGALVASQSQDIIGFLVFALAAGLIGTLLNIIGYRTLIHHESSVRTNLYDTTFSRLLHKDFSFFVNTKVGALTSRFIDFGRAHIQLQDALIIRTIGFVLTVSVSLIIVGLSVPILAISLGVLTVIILVHIRWSMKRRKPWRLARKEIIAEVHGKTADGLTNNLIVKTFVGEEAEEKIMHQDMLRLHTAYTKDMGMFATDGSFRIGLMVFVQVIGIALCTYLVFQGSLDIAIAIFALTYLQRIGTQIFSLGEVIGAYEQAFLDASPMTEILSTPSAITDADDAQDLVEENPVVSFNNVTYHYPEKSQKVLDDVSLTIPAGQKVGLVGHSGAGKTTLTHLLLRFDDVSGGSIHIGDHDIRTITQASLRENISFVPQEPLLFHRTLRDNIAYGKPGATDKEVKRAAEQANALEFIEQLPEGFDTLVGERGVKLSGGQRQRIAIARALLKDAPLLILDEATSALDSESEKLIQDALSDLMKGRTSIVIAHRLSTIAKLDRIIVLSKGKIAEDGTHQELLKKEGIYANLWKHQSGGFIDE